MSNTLKILSVAAVLLIIIGVTYQQRQFKHQKDTLGIVRDSLEARQLTEKVLQKQLRETESTKQSYKIRIRKLQDSVYVLKKRVMKLNRELQAQGKIIVENRKKIEELRSASKELLDVIAKMRLSKDSDIRKVADLEEKRFKLDKEIGELFMTNDTLEQKIVNETVEKEVLKEELEKMSEKDLIFEIQNKVQVNFTSVLARKATVKDKAKNAKRWKKTLINLNLDYEDLDLVMNEYFMIQIVDEDLDKVISPRESNAGNDTPGLLFRFKGNPVRQISYPNYEKKSGKNYSVRILYKKNGKLYSMNKGGYEKIDFSK